MTYTLHQGNLPLLISCPHSGTEIPQDIAARMLPHALDVPDTDWFVDRLYAFARHMGASMIVPRYSRYVIDLNRASDGHALYPGRRETGLVPVISFADQSLYQAGQEPDSEEIQSRIQTYWQPYHQAISDELGRLRTRHADVVIWDAHSILSVVPMFFEGRLPDLNLGTADGTTAAPRIERRVVAAMQAQTALTSITNGRFKGGYITRRFGQPEQGIHALQMEMAQDCYMDESPPTWNESKAAAASAVLETLIQAVLDGLAQ